MNKSALKTLLEPTLESPYLFLNNYASVYLNTSITTSLQEFYDFIGPGISFADPLLYDFKTKLNALLLDYWGLYGKFTPIVMPKQYLSYTINLLSLLEFNQAAAIDVVKDTYFTGNKVFYAFIPSIDESVKKQSRLYLIVPFVSYITAKPVTTVPYKDDKKAKKQQNDASAQPLSYADTDTIWDITPFVPFLLDKFEGSNTSEHKSAIEFLQGNWPYTLPTDFDTAPFLLLDLALLNIPFNYVVLFVNTQHVFTGENTLQFFDFLAGIRQEQPILSQFDYMLNISAYLQALSDVSASASLWLANKILYGAASNSLDAAKNENKKTSILEPLQQVQKVLLQEFVESSSRITPNEDVVFNLSLKLPAEMAMHSHKQLLQNKIVTYLYLADFNNAYIVFSGHPGLQDQGARLPLDLITYSLH